MKVSHLKGALVFAIKAIIYIGVLLTLWQVLIWHFEVPSYIAPSPQDVVASYAKLPAYYWGHFLVTLQEASLGISIGFFFGFVVGVVLKYGGVVGRLLNPLVISSQVFPKEALSVLFVIYLGYGMAPKIVISSLICFFPVAINTLEGLSAAPARFHHAFHTFGASAWQRFLHCDLPFSARHIGSSLRICSVLGLVGAVVGELVATGGQGLGYVIRSSTTDLGTERIYGALLLLGLLGGILYGLAAFIDRTLLRTFRFNS